MRNSTVHIIEPTLASQAGHCYSYVSALVNSQPERISTTLWIEKAGKDLPFHQPCEIRAIFSRRWRKLQAPWLYRRLLKQDGTLFIPTAGRFDMVWLNHWQNKHSKAQVVLHFHQLSKSPKKLTQLKKIAKQNAARWHILTPTDRLSQVFVDAGFEQVNTVACPSFDPITNPKPQAFRHVLFAGAARTDKGFSACVATCERANKLKRNIPFCIQSSPPESGRFDTSSEQAIQRLKQINSPWLHYNTKTLDQASYQAQFSGSICLLVYNNESYRDKFSGVALDAICQGAPIITTSDTWIADTVTRYQAGLIIDNTSPETILSAIDQLHKEYTSYQRNCLAAGKTLGQIHDPKHTWEQLL